MWNGLLGKNYTPSGARQEIFEVFLHEKPSNKANLDRLDNALKDWSKCGESQGKSCVHFTENMGVMFTNRLTVAACINDSNVHTKGELSVFKKINNCS